jgi:hypothetical protein
MDERSRCGCRQGHRRAELSAPTPKFLERHPFRCLCFLPVLSVLDAASTLTVIARPEVVNHPTAKVSFLLALGWRLLSEVESLSHVTQVPELCSFGNGAKILHLRLVAESAPKDRHSAPKTAPEGLLTVRRALRRGQGEEGMLVSVWEASLLGALVFDLRERRDPLFGTGRATHFPP